MKGYKICKKIDDRYFSMFALGFDYSNYNLHLQDKSVQEYIIGHWTNRDEGFGALVLFKTREDVSGFRYSDEVILEALYVESKIQGVFAPRNLPQFPARLPNGTVFAESIKIQREIARDYPY